MARRTIKEPEALRGYDEVFLECRLGYWWRLQGTYWDGPNDIKRVSECERCGKIRTVVWGSDGTIFRRTYSEVPGYHVDGGVSALEVRQAVLARVKVFGSHAEMVEATMAEATAEMAEIVASANGRKAASRVRQ